VSEPCTVLIGAADLLEPLKERAGANNGELFTFSSTDALQALELITKRRPGVVAMERAFAATPRGTALINRIKADPKLAETEIRVLAHDSNYSRVVPRTVPAPQPPLDQRGTRRAARFKMADKVTVLIDGKGAALLDLSTIGAQVVSSAMLKPNQRVQMGLKDEGVDVRFNGIVAWTSFEIPPSGAPRYRGGIAFEDADAGAVDAFCVRHRA
jgi:hypothetical protein